MTRGIRSEIWLGHPENQRVPICGTSLERFGPAFNPFKFFVVWPAAAGESALKPLVVTQVPPAREVPDSCRFQARYHALRLCDTAGAGGGSCRGGSEAFRRGSQAAIQVSPP